MSQLPTPSSYDANAPITFQGHFAVAKFLISKLSRNRNAHTARLPNQINIGTNGAMPGTNFGLMKILPASDYNAIILLRVAEEIKQS
jgi:hypothetical protein